MEYLNFDVAIGPGAGTYPVSVLRSPAGAPRGELKLPFTGLELENRLQAIEIAVLKSAGGRRRVLAPEDRAVQEFGQALFDALVSGEVRSSFDVSRSLALREGRGLRVRLRIEPPELSVLPWEFLYDSRQGEFLCLSVFTPVVRYLDLPGSVEPVELSPPLRVLAMASAPDDQVALNVEREHRRVSEALRPLEEMGKVEVTWLQEQTWRALQRAMRRGPWHIFHFVGHGRFDPERDEGFIELADEAGRSEPLSATQLARLLADQPTLRLVELNACEGARGSARDIFSGTASILVRRGIPAVLAMQYEISDRAAVEFSRSFYEALAEGLSVDAACAEARKAISVSQPMTLEWGTPVLCMRTPDGALFSIQPGAVAPITEPLPPSHEESRVAALPPLVPATTRSASDREAEPTTSGPAAPARPGRRARAVVAAVAALAVVSAAVVFALTRSSGERSGATTTLAGPSAGSSAPTGVSPTPTQVASPLPELQAVFRHRSGFPFDLRYPSSWGEERLEYMEGFGDTSWLSPMPGLLRPATLFSDALREALASDPGRVIGAVLTDLKYGYDRATFEADLGLAPGQPIQRTRITVDEARGIAADRIEGVAEDPDGSGLAVHVVAYGYELNPEAGGLWSVVVFLASEEAFAGDAAGGALFDAIAATLAFDEGELNETLN